MKRFYVAILLIGMFVNTSFGQSQSKVFVGIQPAITVEPFYDEGELDINVLPIVVEKPMSLRTNLRFTPIVNYHIGGLSKGFSDISLFAVVPVFFNKRAIENPKPYGFYVGPVLGFGRNLMNKHYTTTVALEPGYLFEAKKKFTIALGLQLGASHFTYDDIPNKWVSHWGPKVSFGFWLP